MAKGYLITPEVEALIVAIHHNNPKWKPKEVRLVARNILLERSKKYPEKYPDLPLKLSKGWPSLSSVRSKAFSKSKSDTYKPGTTESISKDEPWSIATLSEANYSIPPEAMPVVMSFYRKRLAKDDELPIREALWAARLYKIVEPLDSLFAWAFIYGITEWAARESGKPFETKELDLRLIETPQYACETMREIDIWEIAIKYDACAMKLKALNLSLEKTEEAAKSGKYKWKGTEEFLRWNKPEVQNERKHKAKR